MGEADRQGGARLFIYCLDATADDENFLTTVNVRWLPGSAWIVMEVEVKESCGGGRGMVLPLKQTGQEPFTLP